MSEQFKNKMEYQRNRGQIIPINTNTRPLTLLTWYRHFNKKWRG